MYMEDVCTIQKTDDGNFVVQIQPPKKKEKDKKATKGGEPEVVAGRPEPKTYIANNLGELIALLADKLDQSNPESKKYAKGFDKE